MAQFLPQSSNLPIQTFNSIERIDGRTLFLPELVNGWTPTGTGEQWFALDLGQPRSLARAELAFYADGKTFAAPVSYRLQVRRGDKWEDLAVGTGPAIANGITSLRWNPAAVHELRLIVSPRQGHSVRLIELKLF